MGWTELHSALLSEAFGRILGRPEKGSVAFVRCLSPEVVELLASDAGFAPGGWTIRRVADRNDENRRTVTADQAVELREGKEAPLVLLVDTTRAGAGMDGIYSAAKEVDETGLFREAMGRAGAAVTRRFSGEVRRAAELAIKKARGYGNRYGIPPWTEFDFLVQIAASGGPPGEFLHLLGLWPVQSAEGPALTASDLELSRLFVDRLLGTSVAGQPPGRRIAALKLHNPTVAQSADLERFLHKAASVATREAFQQLGGQRHLWIGPLRVEDAPEAVSGLELIPWRTGTGKLARWSGLVESSSDEPSVPVLLLDPDADRNGNYARLEVRWRVRPENLGKGAAEYRVAIVTDLEEELAVREVSHSGKKEEKCRFGNDDFALLGDDALVSAKAVVSVVGTDQVESEESEEFQIRFGASPAHESGGLGKKFRTLSDALIELDEREEVAAIAASPERLAVDGKNFLLIRTSHRGKNFRVYAPPLIREIEQAWATVAGAVGRWRVRVRASGARADAPEFVPIDLPENRSATAAWDRTVAASRKLSERLATRSGCGQLYDQAAKGYEAVKEYLLAWASLLEQGIPALSLANTVEVQSLAGRTIGLIVLPCHPVRVAWHAAYDNLLLHAAFEQGLPAKRIREEFAALDGAMFPAFLPGLSPGRTFVFADTLGMHAVGMVADDDKEPKAAISLLARALGESDAADTGPTVGRQSAKILGQEICKYLDCHERARFVQVHALRAGDGLTVARSLGHVQGQYRRDADLEHEEEPGRDAPAFVLELYPSAEQRAVAGRFIAEAREKRRTGAGVLAEEDRWMLESVNLPGGLYLPRLRWAKKGDGDPLRAAHLAVAFDTFDSLVAGEDSADPPKPRPLFAYGLMSFFEREYASLPSPVWRSRVAAASDGEKHPADRLHTDRLARLQQLTQRSVARNLGAERGGLVLRTEISPEKADNLRQLHRLCDWVITLDRNAGIEYFDSPRDNREIYEAYVIDCVPEREDLGCLQLITSTSSLDEVRRLLDRALNQMGLSQSRRNAEFLMGHLKALSGRLAIRLTGQRAPTSELIALALSHAHARRAFDSHPCWPSLRSGFLIPVDDVQDLLPPVGEPGPDKDAAAARAVRPDLIHVSLLPRSGLLFRFVEVKYRRHLRDARSPEVLAAISDQVESLRSRWEEWYASDLVTASFRAVRRAKLARVLRFYADKARRHADDGSGEGLTAEAYSALVGEIDKMVERGADYSFAAGDAADRGWVFCPDFAGSQPLEISPPEWQTKVYLFGPQQLPDSPAPLVPAGAGDGPAPQVGRDRPSDSSDRPQQSPGPVQGDTPDQTPVATPDRGETLGVDPPPAIVLGTDPLTRREVCWPLVLNGNPHLLVAGLPGMGKTTCLLNLCRQMITSGVRPIVFSYHEDIDERLKQHVPGVRFLDFRGLGFNPLEVIDRTSRLGYLDVAGALRDIFSAIYPDLGDLQGESIRNAIKQSFVEQGWDAPGADLEAIREPDFGRFVEILRSNPKPDAGLRALLARLGELADYGFFEVAESRESLWDIGDSIVIRIHRTQNEVLQRAFAAIVFYKLYKDMFRRGIQTRITHAVIFDEAHRAARLTLIPTMAKECRKYGISLVLASQEARDFHTSLFSAIANYLILRMTEADAKTLVRNVATSEQERTMVDRIKQMERFKALYFSEQAKKPSMVTLQPSL